MLISGLAQKEKQRLIKIAPKLEGRIMAKGFPIEEDNDVLPECLRKAELDLIMKHQKNNSKMIERKQSFRGEIQDYFEAQNEDKDQKN